MKITVSIDSFKGSLSTFEASSAVKEGVLRVYPTADVVCVPLADGGEGTVEAIVSAGEGELISINVSGPLSRPVTAVYGYIKKTKTAVIEMSSAAGITLIKDSERNPLYTTTFGVGEMILDALDKGCNRFVIGIGGSATNDGGTGMLSALGFEFLDKNENPIKQGAQGLCDLSKIKTDKVDKRLFECSFNIACDVTNPLCGEFGCSRIYGPQKGADEPMIEDMDRWLKNYASLTKSIFPNADESYPGCGAAGGMGFAFMSYLGGNLTSGAKLVTRETSLENHIKDSDIVITGEGRLDGQTAMGKAPVGVAKIAKKYGKRVIAFCGAVTDEAVLCNKSGIDAFFPILRKPCSLDEAMDKQNAYKNMADTAEQVFRLINVSE